MEEGICGNHEMEDMADNVDKTTNAKTANGAPCSFDHNHTLHLG